MKYKIVFFCIIILAAVFRLVGLGTVPPSPNWDEVALGYNAYSLLETGKDEYGKAWPIILRSYDDYKPALYAYFTIPFIQLFGLQTFVVRLPSALMGILAVGGTYFLLKELFTQSGKKKAGEIIALLGSFLLAISPWHIQFSRIGFESNAGLGLNILAAVFFLKGLRKPLYLSFASFAAALNLYMYQSDKVFTPLLIGSLVLIFRKQLFTLPKKYILVACLTGVIIAGPMVYATVANKDALARAKGVSVFSDATQLLERSVVRFAKSKESKDIIGMILNNRRVEYVKTVFSGYLVHYDLNWLFITGDLARHHAPHMGLLYLWELPFLLIGIYALLFGPWDRKTKLVIFSWFLIAPIPASITSGVPHAVRTLNILPTFQIFTALGIVFFYTQLKKQQFAIKSVVSLVITTLIAVNLFYYINQYFVQLNYYTSQDWQYGYKEAVTAVTNFNKYDKVVISNKPYLDQSYMFFLFYLKYDPYLYQKEATATSGGFKENHAFGRYEFRPIEWEKENRSNKILYVGRPSDFPEGAKVLKTVNFLNGQAAIKLVEG